MIREIDLETGKRSRVEDIALEYDCVLEKRRDRHERLRWVLRGNPANMRELLERLNDDGLRFESMKGDPYDAAAAVGLELYDYDERRTSHCSLRELIDANADTPEVWQAADRLRPGEHVEIDASGGGGAGTRITRLW